VYCYLQINLHKFRTLLFLPFLVAHCLFYLSLHYPLGDISCSLKEAPLHYAVHPPSIEVLQVAKVKQAPKTVSYPVPLADRPVKVAQRAAEPAEVEHGYAPASSVTAFIPPALFPSRASPALSSLHS